MNTRNHKISHFWITVWDYLKQPLFDTDKPLVLNPFKFQQYENVQFLERCWELDNPLKKHR